MTVSTYSDVWSLVEMDRWTVQHHTATMALFIKTVSVTATNVVADSSFKDVRVLATILYYFGYRNGVKKD
jgi:hypothetical protein